MVKLIQKQFDYLESAQINENEGHNSDFESQTKFAYSHIKSEIMRWAQNYDIIISNEEIEYII